MEGLEWITKESTTTEMVQKWLDTWLEVPKGILKIICSREDAHLIKVSSAHEIKYLKYLVIENKKSALEYSRDNKELWEEFICKYSKNYNGNYTFYKNLLELLGKKENPEVFFLLFFKVAHRNNGIILSTWDYYKIFLQKGTFIVNKINILDEILHILLGTDVHLDEHELFIRIFNNHKDTLYLYQKELILQYLFLYGSTDIQYIHLDELESVYYNSTDSIVKLIILQFIIIIKKVDSKKVQLEPKFIYKIIKDLNFHLEGLMNKAIVYEFYLEYENLSEIDYNSMILAKQHLLNTIAYVEIIEKILEEEMKSSGSMLNKNELRRYICNIVIIHLENIKKNIEKFKNIREYLPEFDLNIILDRLLIIYKFYGKDEMIVKKIIEDLTKEQYFFLLDLIKENSDLEMYSKIEKSKKKKIEYPLELLDAISMEPLDDFIELPDSKIFINKETLQLHLYESDIDPFTRKKITMDAIENYNQQLDVLGRVQQTKMKIDEIFKKSK